MIYRQIITDIGVYSFDFSDDFLSTDTISAISVAGTAGLVELSAKRTAVGLKQYLFVDVSACTVGILYSLACQATAASGAKRTLYHLICVVAEPIGIAAIPSSGATSGTYSAILAQSGTSAPTITASQSSIGTIVYSRTAEGDFLGTLAAAFPANKTHFTWSLAPFVSGNEATAGVEWLTTGTFRIRIRDFAGNLVDGFSILQLSIVVYT